MMNIEVAQNFVYNHGVTKITLEDLRKKFLDSVRNSCVNLSDIKDFCEEEVFEEIRSVQKGKRSMCQMFHTIAFHV